VVLISSLLNGCTGYSVYSDNLESIAPKNWEVHSADNLALPLMMSYPSIHDASGSMLVVYIEGDGYAWHRKNIPSKDPTPHNPIGLKLAELTSGNFDIAYIARPCQFSVKTSERCEQSVWTSHRYGNESISVISQAIDALKKSTSQSVILVGYSGGGVIAALIAASRSDISAFITVAANLDINYWTSLHGVTPLSGSRNPAGLADGLTHIPQVHFVGSRDKVVPASVLESYLQSVHLSTSDHLISLEGYDHSCCWEKNWPELFDSAIAKLNLSPSK
jgi:pimeloyl-ACP methyl ester carboxylesterase